MEEYLKVYRNTSVYHAYRCVDVALFFTTMVKRILFVLGRKDMIAEYHRYSFNI